MLYEYQFLLALLLTIATEISVLILVIHYFYKSQILTIPQTGFVGAIASALTLPYFWFVLPAFITSRLAFMLCGETTIIFVEAILYQQLLKLRFPQALFASLLANIASIILGLLFY